MTQTLYIIQVEPNIFLKTEYIEMGESLLKREIKPYRAELFEEEEEALRLIVDIHEGTSGMYYVNADEFPDLIVKPVSFTVHESNLE